jgi:hypothetical protein
MRHFINWFRETQERAANGISVLLIGVVILVLIALIFVFH